MPISVRSSRLVTEPVTGSAIAIPEPDGTMEGDVVIVVVHMNDNTPTAADNNGATPFTLDVADEEQNTHAVSVFSRRIQAGDPATFNFTLSAPKRWTAIAVTFQSPDQSTIYEVTYLIAKSQPATSINAPDITTLTANAIHCAIALVDGVAVPIGTTPAGYTVEKNGGDMGTAFTYKVIASPGATGAQGFAAASANPGMMAISFVLKSSAGGGSAPKAGVYASRRRRN